mmetsp:Transcript_107715/g.303438  ORF Transcript_107715/g.303438 Transcript_107715/m.303438 type:complete len:486 (-) Transcript_107715:55-1512(-)
MAPARASSAELTRVMALVPKCHDGTSKRIRTAASSLGIWTVPLLLLVLAALGRHPGPARSQYRPPRKPPGPLVLRDRTTKLRDKWTNLPRTAPKEADDALDYFQRTFPDVTTEEHILIERWESLADLFGGMDAATELVYRDASVMRWPKQVAQRAFHFISLYLGPKVARNVVFEQPYLLTRKGRRMRSALPALLNVFGTRRKLAEVCMEYPSLMHVPTSDFYQAMPDMIAVCGSPEAALETGKEAMDRIRRSPVKSVVPECYPTLVAIFGGLTEAHKAINREPLLLKWQGNQFLGRLARLRKLLGRDGAQDALRKAPYMLLHENQRKSRKFQHAFDSLQRIFGTEETRRLTTQRPELLAIGTCLKRALRFAERKLGSPEAVRDNFDSVLRRTGLADHLEWEMKPRPRHGIWTPASKLPMGFPLNHSSWSPHRNPTGLCGPARGQWDEDEELEQGKEEEKEDEDEEWQTWRDEDEAAREGRMLKYA